MRCAAAALRGNVLDDDGAHAGSLQAGEHVLAADETEDVAVPLSTREQYQDGGGGVKRRRSVAASGAGEGALGDVTTVRLHSSGQGRGREGGRGRGRGGDRGAGRARGSFDRSAAHGDEFKPMDYDAMLDGPGRQKRPAGAGRGGRGGRGGRDGGRGRRGGKRTGILDNRADTGYNPFAVENADFQAAARSGSVRSGNKSGTM